MDLLLPARKLRQQLLERFDAGGFAGVHLTPRRIANLAVLEWDRRRGNTRLRGMPIHLEIEISNGCNLRCPACFTGVGDRGRERGHMPFDAFERHLKELGPYLLGVTLTNWGEALLHPRVWDAVRCVRRHGVSALICTNFSLKFTVEDAEALVDSGLNILGVAAGGSTQETYQTYRRHGDLGLVLKNVGLVMDSRKRLNSATPQVIWVYHMFDHNLHEVEEARRMASELGVEFGLSKGWVDGPEWDPELRHEPPVPKPTRCEFLWRRATINNDGGVAPCHGTFFRDDDFAVIGDPSHGRPGAASFKDAWNNENFRRARSYYGDAVGSERDLLCRQCPATTAWNAFQKHLSVGGTRADFGESFTLNEGFNFFFRRRNAELRRVDAASIEVVAPSDEVDAAPAATGQR